MKKNMILKIFALGALVASSQFASAGSIRCTAKTSDGLSVEVTAFSSSSEVNDARVKVDGNLLYAQNFSENEADLKGATKVNLTDKWHSSSFLGLRMAFPEAGADVAVLESFDVALSDDGESATYKAKLKLRVRVQSGEMEELDAVCVTDFSP